MPHPQPQFPPAPTKTIDPDVLKRITELFNLNSNWELTDHRRGISWGTRGGRFIGNEKEKKGRVTYPSKGNAFFEGEFEQDGEYKCGMFVSVEGRCYKCSTWANSMPNGLCKVFNALGQEIYEKRFSNGRREDFEIDPIGQATFESDFHIPCMYSPPPAALGDNKRYVYIICS